jgi:hypothetical protein
MILSLSILARALSTLTVRTRYMLFVNFCSLSADTVCDAPSTTVTTNKDELLKFLKEMYMMRRVEITNDNEYKVPLACQED